MVVRPVNPAPQQWCFDKESQQLKPPQQLERRDEAPEEDKSLHCAVCEALITYAKERTQVSGRHLFTFTNPMGMLYRIGCFREAPGCRSEGQPSAYFTWFPGYTWQIQRCGSCKAHLGWRFEGEQSAFYGLVLKHLIES